VIPTTTVPRQLSPAQREALQRRYDAAQNLERAGQIAREAVRYGKPSKQHADALNAAEVAYKRETILAGWVVVSR
jgi:hypothetical protein